MHDLTPSSLRHLPIAACVRRDARDERVCGRANVHPAAPQMLLAAAGCAAWQAGGGRRPATVADGNDGLTRNFVERIGERLVAEIPHDLRQPKFRYTFDVVNLREINAFALPGGPMFLHRGMLEAARTDAEVAGVMAHELSHVVLRHGTAQASKAQKFQLGAVAGQILGSIVGGRTGTVIAQGSQIGLGTYFLKYSREYEREADLLGAQIMARAATIRARWPTCSRLSHAGAAAEARSG